MVNKLYLALNRALDLACPKTKTKIVDKNNPWWTEKHHEARKQLNKLYRKKQRKPNERSIMKYQNVKTEYEKLCRNSQDKDWSKFKAKTDNIKEMDTVRKNIRRPLCSNAGSLREARWHTY